MLSKSTVQLNTSHLQLEKLEKLEERKVLLEEECELARSNQDQTVEQELLIRGTFDKLSSRRDDMKKK